MSLPCELESSRESGGTQLISSKVKRSISAVITVKMARNCQRLNANAFSGLMAFLASRDQCCTLCEMWGANVGLIGQKQFVFNPVDGVGSNAGLLVRVQGKGAKVEVLRNIS